MHSTGCEETQSRCVAKPLLLYHIHSILPALLLQTQQPVYKKSKCPSIQCSSSLNVIKCFQTERAERARFIIGFTEQNIPFIRCNLGQHLYQKKETNPPPNNPLNDLWKKFSHLTALNAVKQTP